VKRGESKRNTKINSPTDDALKRKNRESPLFKPGASRDGAYALRLQGRGAFHNGRRDRANFRIGLVKVHTHHHEISMGMLRGLKIVGEGGRGKRGPILCEP